MRSIHKQTQCIHTRTDTEQYISVANDICFSANNYVDNYQFSAPFDGEIIGVRLTHKSGYVSCCSDCGSGNWGCGTYNSLIYISMIESNTQETWFPTTATDGQYNMQQLTCQLEQSSWGCSVRHYSLSGYSGTNSLQIQWKNSGNIRQVTTSNSWSIQVLNPTLLCV